MNYKMFFAPLDVFGNKLKYVKQDFNSNYLTLFNSLLMNFGEIC